MPRRRGEASQRWERAIEDARLTEQVIRGGRPSDRLQFNHEGRAAIVVPLNVERGRWAMFYVEAERAWRAEFPTIGSAEVGARTWCYAREHPAQGREFTHPPDGVEIHSDVGRVTINTEDRMAILISAEVEREKAFELRLAERGADGKNRLAWSGYRLDADQAAVVVQGWIEDGRRPEEPSRWPPDFPERYDLPPVPEGVVAHSRGRHLAVYTATPGNDPRRARVERRTSSGMGRYYQVDTFDQEGDREETHMTRTYRQAHMKAREFVRTGCYPAEDMDDRGRPIPIERPAGWPERTKPGRAGHASPSR